MRINLSNAAQSVASVISNVHENVQRLVGGVHKQKSEDEILVDSINQARYELARAESLFNELTDEAAIDYAAYNILATRAKYVYLLDLAKKLHVKF